MRKPEPSDHWNGPPVEPYVKRGEVWRDDPEPLPEGHPEREEWVARLMSRQLNPRLGPPERGR